MNNMANYQSSIGEFHCLEGLHRPFNIPLKQVVWVCKFIKTIWKDQRLNCKLSDVSYLFFKHHVCELHKRYKDREQELEGLILPKNIELIYAEINKLGLIEQKELIFQVLNKKRVLDLDKKIYSAYKNTSYYITLAKKLNFIDEKYSLTSEGYELALHKSNFFKLDSFEKEIILKKILAKDGDMFVPLLVSQPFAMKNKEPNIYLKYIEKCCDLTFFRYIAKSQAANYDKVRYSWIVQLDLITKNGQIHRNCNLIKDGDVYRKHFLKETSFLRKLISEEKKMNSSFQKLEQAYSKLLEKGMHDAKFVNLYDIKDLMHCSYNSLNNIIAQYYEHKKEEKIVLFTNLVQSIDKRRRFFVKKQVPVLKIKIM